MENHIDHPLTVTVEDAAKLLGIGRSTAYELVHTGDIPSLRLGRRLVVPVAHLAESLGVDRDTVRSTLTDEDPEPPSPSRALAWPTATRRQSSSATAGTSTLF